MNVLKLSSESVEQILQEYRARNEALQRRVKFLEMRLEQRFVVTKNDYEQLKPYFERIKTKIINIFLDLPPSVGLTTNELQEEYQRLHPRESTAHLYRRARQLCDDGLLWSCPDENKKNVRFYLKLKPLSETVSGEVKY